MRIAGIIKNSVVNGNGIRDVLFLQGCKHKCKGCHNPQTWKLNGGSWYGVMDLCGKFYTSKNDITISGGEPLLQYDELIVFMELMCKHQHKRFWLYTGFKYEEIEPWLLRQLSKYVDVLVDGKFEEDKKDLTLRFRGSSNQRLIDLPKTVEQGQIVLWEDVNEEVV